MTDSVRVCLLDYWRRSSIILAMMAKCRSGRQPACTVEMEMFMQPSPSFVGLSGKRIRRWIFADSDFPLMGRGWLSLEVEGATELGGTNSLLFSDIIPVKTRLISVNCIITCDSLIFVFILLYVSRFSALYRSCAARWLLKLDKRPFSIF